MTKTECIVVVALATNIGWSCSSPPSQSLPFSEGFDAGKSVPSHWKSRAGGWDIVDGRLFNSEAKNIPLWLDASLPSDVQLSFDAESKSPAVDIKFEIFGDGAAHQSGYVVIFCGWGNSKSIIARLDEHGPERSDAQQISLRAESAKDEKGAEKKYRDSHEIRARGFSGKSNRVYHFKFERRGSELKFFVDGVLHLEYFDPAPLKGAGHDRFALSNWASDVYFDNIKITALGPR